MNRSIRWRFAIPVTVFFILAIFGLSYYLIGAFNQAYQNNIQTVLRDEAHLVASDTGPMLSGVVDAQQLEARAKYFASDLKVRVTIIRADGVVLAESDADPTSMENHSNRPEFQRALTGIDAFQVRRSDTLHANLLYAAVPVKKGDQVIAVVRLARPLTVIEASLDQIRRVVWSLALALAALAFLISVLITEYNLRPIIHLTSAARQVAEGTYPRASLPISNDEFGRLSQAFNQMAAKIESQIEDLKNEQGKTRSVLEQMMDGVIVIDQKGNVQLINPAAERMFKVKGESILGHSAIEALRDHQIVELWKQSSATRTQQSMTFDLLPGKTYLQGIAAPLDQISPGSTLLLIQDLTRQRQLETVRQDFVSNVSHELRTPLASLKALTETLQEGALEDPPVARRFLERMEIEIDTLTQMVRELLELSRIESGKVPLKRRPIQAIDLLTPPFERMRVQAERAGLTMTMHCSENLPPVLADSERMEQVLVNLLHNAIKFTPPDGEIDLSVQQEGSMLVFQVRDNGAGISSKDLPRIFERFYKADRARSGGGTGLGLSIARHIIEAHGGRIWAESIQMKGSSFYFSLPLA